MAKAMHEESWYRDFRFLEARFDKLLQHCYTNSEWLALVAEDDYGELIGFFLAAMTEYFFSDEKYACDLCVYVIPSHRGGSTAARFIKAYEAWGEMKGLSELHLGVSTNVNAERVAQFYQKLGYGTPTIGLRKKCVSQ